MTCQRIAGSEARSHSITASSEDMLRAALTGASNINSG